MTFHLFLVFVMCLVFISLVSLMGCPGHPRKSWKSPYRLRKRTDSQRGDQAPYLAKGHHLQKTEEVQPQKSWLHPRISELATSAGWLLGSHTSLHWHLMWFGKCVIYTSCSNSVVSKYSLPIPSKNLWNSEEMEDWSRGQIEGWEGKTVEMQDSRRATLGKMFASWSNGS